MQDFELSAEKRQSVDNLSASFNREIDGQNDFIVQMTREIEPRRSIQRYENKTADRSQGKPQSSESIASMVAARKKTIEQRGEINARYRDLLEALLTPEQVALLPLDARAAQARMRMQRKKEMAFKQREASQKGPVSKKGAGGK